MHTKAVRARWHTMYPHFTSQGPTSMSVDLSQFGINLAAALMGWQCTREAQDQRGSRRSTGCKVRPENQIIGSRAVPHEN